MLTAPRSIAAAVTVWALLLSGLPARAGGNPAPSRTVASGLDNPRGLTFAPDGILYVAEAGHGGTGPCRPAPEGGTSCFGRSGAITRIDHGRQQRAARSLPSLATAAGAETSGPSDVVVDRRGRIYFTVGLGGAPDLRTRIGRLAGMAKLYLSGGSGPSVVADIGGYEKAANANAVAVIRNGQVVADAGGNSLVRVNPRGRLSTIAVFPSRMVAAPANIPGGPPAGTPIAMQSVPASVVAGPDGALYVGELTGFPFPPGHARVWRVVPGRAPAVYAGGFTNIIDLAWGPDGRLFVLEIARKGLLSGDRTGALIRLERDGRRTVIASAGLTAPAGLAVRGRYAYVSNCSVCAGSGSVLRISLN
jgi:sugar lactone lactonase YvrE